MTEPHQLSQAAVLGLELPLYLAKLLLVTKSLFRKLRVHHFVRPAHLHCLIVLDHDFVKAIAKDSDLAHHGVAVIVQVVCDGRHLICPLLQRVELLALGCCLTLKIVELAPLDRQVLFDVALTFLVVSGFFCSYCLILELALKNFILLLKRVQGLLILGLLVLTALNLLGA